MNDTTYEEVRNNFIQDLAENAYLSMCSMVVTRAIYRNYRQSCRRI